MINADVVVHYPGLGGSILQLQQLEAIPALREDASRARTVLLELYETVTAHAVALMLDSAVTADPEPDREAEPEPAPPASVEPARPAAAAALPTTGEHVCPDCGAVYAKRNGLASHRRAKHTPGQVCPDCGAVCRSQASLSAHRARFHAGDPDPDPDAEPEPAAEPEPVSGSDDAGVQAEIDAAWRQHESPPAAAPAPEVCICGHSGRLHEDRVGACGICECSLLDPR